MRLSRIQKVERLERQLERIRAALEGMERVQARLGAQRPATPLGPLFRRQAE